jgi:hypothetical protein
MTRIRVEAVVDMIELIELIELAWQAKGEVDV